MAISKEKLNISCNAIGEGGWALGAGLGSALTVLPLLIIRLGGSSIEVGLIAAIWAACQLFPQIFSSILLQRGVGRKWFILIYHWIVFTAPWLGMAAVVFWLSSSNPLATRVLLLLLFALFTMGMGFILPVWQDWVANLFHPETRGRAFAWSNFALAIGASLAAWIAGQTTAAIAFPGNYAILFLGSGVIVALCMIMWIPVHEIEVPKHLQSLSPRQILKRFALSLGERNFRSYLISRILLTAGSGPLCFLAIYYNKTGPDGGGGLTEKTIITLGIAVTTGQIIGGWVMGHIGDRIGHKSGAIIGTASQVIGLAIAILVPGTLSCAIAFAMIGVGMASSWISHVNLLFETCPHDCRTAHITVSNMVLAPFTAIIPIMTGRAIDIWSFNKTATFCLVPTVIALFWILIIVREPRTLKSHVNNLEDVHTTTQ